MKVLNLIAESIKFPESYGYYVSNEFYRDKFKYLLAAKIATQVRIFIYYIEYEGDLLTKEKKKNI